MSCAARTSRPLDSYMGASKVEVLWSLVSWLLVGAGARRLSAPWAGCEGSTCATPEPR